MGSWGSWAFRIAVGTVIYFLYFGFERSRHRTGDWNLQSQLLKSVFGGVVMAVSRLPADWIYHSYGITEYFSRFLIFLVFASVGHFLLVLPFWKWCERRRR